MSRWVLLCYPLRPRPLHRASPHEASPACRGELLLQVRGYDAVQQLSFLSIFSRVRCQCPAKADPDPSGEFPASGSSTDCKINVIGDNRQTADQQGEKKKDIVIPFVQCWILDCRRRLSIGLVLISRENWRLGYFCH